MNSTVYINGHKLGTRPYGYSTFEYDLTPYINRKGDNVIAVKVDNSDQPNSRWYSGCGIYRHVWLTKTMKKAYIPQWGQYVSTTPQGDVKVKVDFLANGSISSAVCSNMKLVADGKVLIDDVSDKVLHNDNLRTIYKVTLPDDIRGNNGVELQLRIKNTGMETVSGQVSLIGE